MGKQRGNSSQDNKKNTSKNKHNNVFKVAGSRCLKIKNKAKAVTSQVKKLNEMNRMKTKEVDSQLVHLQEQLLQKPKQDANKPSEDNTIKVEKPVPVIKLNAEKDSLEAMSKLSSMKM